MYDPITEQLIRDIPKFEHIDVDRLPQFLSTVYANVVSAKSQLEHGRLELFEIDEKQCTKTLNSLILGLESLMTQPLYEEKLESLAFVTATAYSLKSMLFQQKNAEGVVSMDYVSSNVCTMLLFLIANDVTDAVEVSRIVRTDDTCQGQLVSMIKKLSQGKLNEIKDFALLLPEFADDYQEYAIQLLIYQLSLAVKDIADYFLGEVDELNVEKIYQVKDLSSFQLDTFKQRDTYVGISKIAHLLEMAAYQLKETALVRIPVPNGVDDELWRGFLKRRSKEGRPFLWRNHEEAVRLNFLDNGVSSVFTYPTGAGKSTVVQLKIAAALFSGRDVVVLVPTHALEEQTRWELSRLFGEKARDTVFAGGEFSDFFDDQSEHVMVMTPERCLTLLNGNFDKLADVGLVVFDEFHLMGEVNTADNTRNLTAMFTMLEIFDKLPGVDFVLLSAMVKNGEEIADWLRNVTHRECLLFDDHWKPTRQLQGCLLYDAEEIEQLRNEARANPHDLKRPRLAEKMNASPFCLFSLKSIWDDRNVNNYCKIRLLNHKVRLALGSKLQLTANRFHVASEIASSFAQSGLRVMVFVDTPRNAVSVQKNINEILGIHGTDEILDNEGRELVGQIADELGNIDYSYLVRGSSCVVHHGLLLPEERHLMEDSYRRSSNVIVATPTLAQGVNLPADIVIIAGHDRYDAQQGERANVEAHEILNAAGRAGRAGLNSYGAVILVPNHVLGYKDNTIDKEWFEIQKEVFSQGDQCFVVKDPIEHFVTELLTTSKIESIGEEILLYRLGSDEGRAKIMLSRSLAAFICKKNGKENFDESATKLVSISKTETHDEFLEDMSVKFGVNVDKLLVLQRWVEDLEISDVMDKSPIGLVALFFDFLSDHIGILDSLLSNSSVLGRIGNILKIESFDSSLDSTMIGKLKEMTSMYMEGKSLCEISDAMPPSKSNHHLENARKFVLTVIPAISYAVGIWVWMLKKKADDENISIDGDILSLATIVKEGMSSFDMLKYKNEHRLMRVICHNEYGKF